MRKFLTLLAVASLLAGLLAGCAGTRPACDGHGRRPINVPARVAVDYPSCGSAA